MLFIGIQAIPDMYRRRIIFREWFKAYAASILAGILSSAFNKGCSWYQMVPRLCALLHRGNKNLQNEFHFSTSKHKIIKSCCLQWDTHMCISALQKARPENTHVQQQFYIQTSTPESTPNCKLTTSQIKFPRQIGSHITHQLLPQSKSNLQA